MKIPILLIFISVVLPTAHAATVQGRAETQGNLRLEVVSIPDEVQAGFKDLNGQALLYHPIKRPEGKTPLIVFLHGAGGTRRDLAAFQWRGEVRQFAKLANEMHAAKLLVPQSSSLWDPGSLDKMLDHILTTSPDIDQNRIYCIGFSMGGKGTWEWAMASPQRFAAIIPMAFIADTGKLDEMKQLPIWAFAGTADRRRAQSIPNIEKGLQALGSTVVRTTIYEGVNHADTYDRAWATEGLLEWLFAQSRKP